MPASIIIYDSGTWHVQSANSILQPVGRRDRSTQWRTSNDFVRRTLNIQSGILVAIWCKTNVTLYGKLAMYVCLFVCHEIKQTCCGRMVGRTAFILGSLEWSIPQVWGRVKCAAVSPVKIQYNIFDLRRHNSLHAARPRRWPSNMGG